MSNETEKTQSGSIARMLLLGKGGHTRLWRDDELQSICRHQLAAPIEFDLDSLPLRPAQGKQVAMTCAAQNLLIRSFADLLHHPHPPVELLEMIRQYAKACRADPEGALPPEVASVLYYAAILVAQMRCQTRIGSLGDDALKAGTRKLLSYAWLDQPMRGLFEEGLKHLERA